MLFKISSNNVSLCNSVCCEELCQRINAFGCSPYKKITNEYCALGLVKLSANYIDILSIELKTEYYFAKFVLITPISLQ